MRFSKHLVMAFLAVMVIGSPGWGKSASVLLQEGLYQEQMEGNPDAAAGMYQQVLEDSSASSKEKAQAQFRLGQCYIRKNEENLARQAFEALIAKYPEEEALVQEARSLLEGLTYLDPASLMPPDTVLYLEAGRPGRQIETILNLLKGTPFENPLAALGGKPQSNQNNQKKPEDIIAALLNPSMMTEFKKIRGMAIGMSGIGNQPPIVAVLCPGKSDALRGLILAGLGMKGQPGEPIEGMQTVRMGETAGAVYDEEVIFMVQDPKPLERMLECVRRYRGLEPGSLLSKNQAFANIPRSQREENALTIWGDPKTLWKGVQAMNLPERKRNELRVIDAFADFGSMEEVLVGLTLEEKGLSLQGTMKLAEGHHCLAYDLIRTEPLSREGLEAVPANTFALVSVALGKASEGSIETLRGPVQRLTGLDVGRELFDNIEQITVFALPPAVLGEYPAWAQQSSPVFANLGLVITSRDPARTKQLLETILGVVCVEGSASSAAGTYPVAKIQGEMVYCTLKQEGRATILGLRPEVVDASVSALKNKTSVLMEGPLSASLKELTAGVDKLIRVDAQGMMQSLNAHHHRQLVLKPGEDISLYPYAKTLQDLEQALGSAGGGFCTKEQPNQFSFNVRIQDLPPITNLVPLMMQAEQIKPRNFTPQAIRPRPSNDGSMDIRGKKELEWIPAIRAVRHQVYWGPDKEKLELLSETDKPSLEITKEMNGGQTYSWRVDEVYENGAVTAGKVWSFRSGILLGEWNLTESEGTEAADTSGNGNPGQVIGQPLWQAKGERGSASMKFDGNTVVQIANESAFDITDSITVSAWIQVNAFDKEWQTILSKGDSAWRLLRDQTNGQVRFCCSGVKNGQKGVVSRTSVEDGHWYHMVGVYDGQKMYLYIDGKREGSVEASGKIGTNDFPVQIGGNAEEPGRQWNGEICHVRVYNYPMSAEEVRKLYRKK